MPRQRTTPRGRLRQLAAAGAIVGLAGLAPAAAAGGAATALASTVTSASQHQVTVAITSISPQIARPGKPVTVSGTVTNPTGSPVSDLAVQLWSSTARFTTRSQLASYAAGQLQVDAPVTGAVDQLAGSLKPGATRQWTVTVPVATLGFASGFGVYPLAAQLDSAGFAGGRRLHVPAVLAGQRPGRRADPAGAGGLDLAADRAARAGGLPRAAGRRPGQQPGQHRPARRAAGRRHQLGRAGREPDLGYRPEPAVQRGADDPPLPGGRHTGLHRHADQAGQPGRPGLAGQGPCAGQPAGLLHHPVRRCGRVRAGARRPGQ